MNIQFKKLTMVPLSKEHIYDLGKLRNKDYIRKYLRQTNFCNDTSQEKWFNGLNNSSYIFPLVDSKNKAVGCVHIVNIDYIRRNAEVGWFLDEKYHGGGYASFFVKKLFEFAFIELDMESLYATVYSDNQRGLSFINKIGMKKAGELRRRRLREQTYASEIMFDIIREEVIW